MEESIKKTIVALTDHANEVIKGCYKNTDKIFSLTDNTRNSPDIANLAEAFGMMVVKVEAREYQLEKTIEELKEKKGTIENLLLLRSQLSSIFISTVLLITFYIFILGFLETPSIKNLPNIDSIHIYVYRIVEVLALAIVITIITKMHLPIRDFGINLNGWKRSIIESVLISMAVIILLALLKIFLNNSHPGIFKETQIFNFGYFGITYITYIIVAPIQEFIARGVMQGSLSKLFSGKNSGLLAILVTSFLFGALHMCHSISLSVVALLTSWLWGWMYNRQKNLLGISISHFLIGNATDLMGYWTFFS